MRKIAIAGAGQSGLHLALALLQAGYDVTLFSDKTADQIFNSAPTGGTYLFHSSLQLEDALGINAWKHRAFYSTAFDINFGTPDGAFAFGLHADLRQPGVSIDQRLKFHHWIELFQQRGGKFVVGDVDIPAVERWTQTFDLVIISTGKGPLCGLFTRDDARSTWDMVARKLVQLHITSRYDLPFKSINLGNIMEGGQIITAPFYHKSGLQCAWLLMEVIPGSILDVFDDVQGGPALLAKAKEVINRYMPWQAAAFDDVMLVDDNAFLKGSFVPVVRHPVATLANKAPILGLGDTVILNDPIVGQGGNNATKMAHHYATSILAHGDRPYDAAWMQRTFDSFWQYSQYVNQFCDIFLLPPSPHVMRIIDAARFNPSITADLVNGFNHPPDLFPWIDEPAAGTAYLERKAGAVAAPGVIL
ncbi:styrene monooxygenase/indole monooxygenase family protein [Parachryseolinea silvisoli]|uniref:styrene monooxygenase/indole monooxygenase family protein n=1 Tax=Parachryseolinea silvisoli TaxID=2873601 RepID=UPI002265BB51|nr:styrene monooxygenase/indole monooxygenase family protein [Parachryseolinea silvisoli]MCD9015709.1 hypothetical protein [Parachryseolinea silvisoli]